jgi:hypothetical protein
MPHWKVLTFARPVVPFGSIFAVGPSSTTSQDLHGEAVPDFPFIGAVNLAVS